MSAPLSEIRFNNGIQRHLRRWYDVHERSLRTPTKPAQQSIFDDGPKVAEFACQRHVNGKLVGWDHFHVNKASNETVELMSDERVRAIFEAAFNFDDVQCRVDVFKRLEFVGWEMIAFKSTRGALVSMLQCKSEWYGKHFVRIDPWFPSTKTCTDCGISRRSIGRGVRTWIYLVCGHQHQEGRNSIDEEGTFVRLCLSRPVQNRHVAGSGL